MATQTKQSATQSQTIANARSQYSNGKIILRGVDCNINSMPSYTIAEISKSEKAAKAVAY